MGVFNFVAILGALVLVALGGGGVWFVDHHPPLGWHAHLLFWHPGFDLPDSLRTQRDKALVAELDANLGQARCRDALDVQSASVKRLGAESTAKTAAAAKAIADAAAAAEGYRTTSITLKTYAPVGFDVCARWRDADRAVEGALR